MKLSPEQYYPTYAFSHRDVVAIELQEAYKEAAGQGRLYTQLSSVLLGTATLLFSLTRFEGVPSFASSWFTGSRIFWFTTAASFVLALVLLYFSDLQTSIIINRRKVVILRTMLGMDYGTMQAVLPASRIEGAVNPFTIRMFPGWFSYVALPYWLILFSATALWRSVTDAGILESTGLTASYFCGFWLVLYSLLFRSRLFEPHETFGIIATLVVAKMLKLRLVPSLEYATYRSKLAAVELERLGFDTSVVRDLVLAIEDHRFYRHKGISLRSYLRAGASQIPAVRRHFHLTPSGASTITMQLARTLYIVDYHKLFRRKLVESFIALWLENQFTKTEILDMYLASVRFANGVFGLAAASKHYFSGTKRGFSAEEAFLLVERLSATSPSFREDRIRGLAQRAMERSGGTAIHLDYSEIEALYNSILR